MWPLLPREDTHAPGRRLSKDAINGPEVTVRPLAVEHDFETTLLVLRGQRPVAVKDALRRDRDTTAVLAKPYLRLPVLPLVHHPDRDITIGVRGVAYYHLENGTPVVLMVAQRTHFFLHG